MSRERYRIGDLTVDVGAARVERAGEEVSLRGLSFDLLVTLARHAPDVVGHDRLAAEVWNLSSVTDETIMQRVTLLRRALGDDASEPTYVRSVRGRGYALVAEVEALEDRVESRKGPWKLATAAVLIAAAVVLVALLAPESSGTEPLETESPETSAAVRTVPLSADELVGQAQEFLSRHRDADNELAIDLYERALALEPEHGGAMIGLSFALTQRVTKFNRSPENTARALELAERRLAVAPDDASAHYARGFALDALGQIGPALDAYLEASELAPERPGPRADAAYLEMIRGNITDSLVGSLQVLESGGRLHYLEIEIGWALALLGFDSAAAVWLQRALDLWPDSVFAGSSYAEFRLHQGQLGEAERLAQQAIDRGVERAELSTLLGNVALMRGDPVEAARRFRESSELDPRLDEGTLRLLVLEAGEPAAHERYLELVEELEHSQEKGDEWPGAAIGQMVLHAGFGEPQAALAALDRAIDLGYRESSWLMLDPLLGDLREDPGFLERIERIALEIEGERAALLADPSLVDAFLEFGAQG